MSLGRVVAARCRRLSVIKFRVAPPPLRHPDPFGPVLGGVGELGHTLAFDGKPDEPFCGIHRALPFHMSGTLRTNLGVNEGFPERHIKIDIFALPVGKYRCRNQWVLRPATAGPARYRRVLQRETEGQVHTHLFG
jgi:hypothetical protein